MSNRHDDAVINVLVWGGIIIAGAAYFRRRRHTRTEFGTASWASEKLLKDWGMLGPYGLIVGRTLGGTLLRIPRFCHGLLIGSPGSGKGIGILFPNLLDDAHRSVVVHDTKGDLFAGTAERRRKKGSRIIRLAPFNGGQDRLNPLDTIPDGPLLIDSAKALAESLVVRPPSGAHEPHWDDKAAQVITAILVLVLKRM